MNGPLLLVETASPPRPPADPLAAEHRRRYAQALDSVVTGPGGTPVPSRRTAAGGELALHGIPLGAAFLAAAVRQAGREVLHAPLVLEAARGRDPAEALAAAVREQLPAVVGITLNHTLEESVALRLARAAREARPGVRVLLGGLHATFRAEALAADPAVDGVVRFEGEETLVPAWEWLEGRREAGTVPGLAARIGERVVLVPPGPPVDFARRRPDYDAVAADRYVAAGILAHVQTARGCPYACHYCCHTAFWGREVRYRDAGLVAEETADLIRRGCDLIYLTDSTFTLHDHRVRDLADAFVRHGADRAAYAVETRLDRLDDTTLDRLARMGVRIIALGVETVSPEVLAAVPDKRSADPAAAVRQAVRRIGARGMHAYASLVLGLPGETAESLAALVETVEGLYAEGDALLWADAKLARAFPGSAFAADPDRLHAVLDSRWEHYDFYGRVTVTLPDGPSPEQILAARRAIMERNVAAWRRRRPDPPGAPPPTPPEDPRGP